MTNTAASQVASIWTELTRARRALMVVEPAGPEDAAGDGSWQALIEHMEHRLPPGRRGLVLGEQAGRLLMSFEQGDHAIAAALAIQLAPSGPSPRRLRVGVQAQDAFAPAGSIDAGLAAGLALLAGPGEVMLSAALRDQVVAGLDAEFEDLGESRLPGMSEPVQVFRMQPCTDAASPWGAFADRMPTLVMLPLRVVPGNRCDPVYAELISYGVTRSLAQNKAWHLISRLSSEAFRLRKPGADELQQRLRATHVITGTVSVEGKLLHAQLELTDTRSGERVWAERVSHPLHLARGAENPFGRAVLAAVSLAIFGKAAEAGAGIRLGELDSYTMLFGATALMHHASLPDFARSHAMLEHLAQRHPEACEPHAWLAKWHVMRVARGHSPDIEADSALARQHAARALQGEGERALALAIDGVVHSYLLLDLDHAEAQLTQAIAANGNESLAWLFLSAVNVYRGRGSAAADAACMAQMLSPLDPMRYYFDSFTAHAMLAADRLNEAIVLASRSLSANSRHLPTLRTLAIARMLNDQQAQANVAVNALRRLDPSYSVEQFETRYPGRGTAFAERCAQALRNAGLP